MANVTGCNLKTIGDKMNIESILDEREKTHGKYSAHACITQNLKTIIKHCDGWNNLTNCQRESLEMIAHKIGRIITGNPNTLDHWADIAGYATLICKEIEANESIQH